MIDKRKLKKYLKEFDWKRYLLTLGLALLHVGSYIGFGVLLVFGALGSVSLGWAAFWLVVIMLAPIVVGAISSGRFM